MKTLFKSAFFGFFKSRIAMTLLAILVFLSTITFTILSTTSQAIDNSYNTVVTNGKLHDFTVKQKYNISGNQNYQSKFVRTDKVVVKENNKNKTYYKNYFTFKFSAANSSGSYLQNINSNEYQKIIDDEFKNFSDKSSTRENSLYYITNQDLKISIKDFNKLTATQKAQKIMENSKIMLLINKVKKRVNEQIFRNFETNFKQTIENKYGSKLENTSVKSIAVNAGNKSYKVVNASHREGAVNKLVIFDGFNVDKPLTTKELAKRANNNLGYSLANTDGRSPNEIVDKTSDKAYKVIAYYDTTRLKIVLSPYSYTDPSSLMAVVSPSYFQENNLQIINPEIIKKIYQDELKASKLNDPFARIRDKIAKQYSKNVVWVDSTPYFVVGVGTSPDFAFPIIDQTRPIPDIKSQAIIFVNDHGYERIIDAFRNNPKENYLAYRFKNNVTSKEKNEIINFAEKTAQDKMAWGKNVSHIISKQYDTSESVIMAPHRITTIDNFKKTISFVTYATLVLLILFAAFVVVLVIKRQINANKRTYGVLLANGYSKSQIALSNISIALLIGLIPTISGYIIGVSFQWAFVLIFKDYWTLPFEKVTFDILSLILTVLIPIAGFSLLAFITSYWAVRSNVPSLISGASKISSNLNLRFISPLKWIRIRIKTSLALFLSNLPKMFVVFLSITGSTVAISNSLSIYNKFDIAKTQSLAATNYEYKLDLANPTTQGGLMKLMPIEKIGIETIPNAKDINDPKVNSKNLLKASTQESYKGKSKFMVPNLKDQENSEKPFYVDGIVQQKALLNVFSGISNFGAGPWQIAEKLMPENQLNQASSQYVSFINYAAHLKANKEPLKDLPNNKSLRDLLLETKYLSRESKNSDRYVVRPSDFNKINSLSSQSFSDPLVTTKEYEYLKTFIFNGLKAVINKYNNPQTPENKRLTNMPFFLSYRNIIANSDDETFTRIEGKTNLIDNEGHKGKEKIDILGVNATTRFINFNDGSMRALVDHQDDKYLPVIANRFFLFRYQKKVGDTFSYQISNHKNRFNNDYIEKTIKIKIVGIQNSYASSKIYTLKKLAVKALGWDINNQKEKQMFNGIFTSHKNSILFKTISIYSLSGLYPKAAKIIKGTKVAKNIETELQKNPIAGATNLDEFERKFTLSPYVMVYKDVSWRYTNEHRFNSLVDISSKLIYIVQGITLTLAILFILIISLMMIFDSKKFISTMRVMGYRRGEISRIFFMSFIPTLILAFFAAAPISFGIAEGLRITIASYSNIYIPIALTWWTIIVSTLITFLIVLLVYVLVDRHLRKIPIQQAFE